MYYHAVPKKKRAPSNSTTIVIDMAHWRALKSPSTVVRSMDEDPEPVQFGLIESGALREKSLTTSEIVELWSNSLATKFTELAVVAKVFLRISEI